MSRVHSSGRPGDRRLILLVAAALLPAACAETTTVRPPVDPGVRQEIVAQGPVSSEFNVLIAKPVAKPRAAVVSALPPAPVLDELRMPELLTAPVLPAIPERPAVDQPTAVPPSAPLAMPAGLQRPTTAPPAPPSIPASPAAPPNQLAALPSAPPAPPPGVARTPVPAVAAEAIARAAAELGRRKFRVVYRESTVDLPTEPSTVAQLTELAELLKLSDKTRLQLQAYASGSPDSPVEARQLSMQRAEAVRTFLVQQGIRRSRIDLRPLGIAGDDGPADRIDLVPLN